MRIHKLLLPVIASLLLALPAAAEPMPKPAKIETEAPSPLPAIGFLDAQGNKATLDAGKAKLTILHFWATWCPPCVVELPEVDKIAAAYKDKGVQVVALSLDGGNMKRIMDFYKSHHIDTLAANFDKGTAAIRAVKGKGLPYTVFINGKGEIIARAQGWVEWDKPATQKFINNSLNDK